MIETIALIVTIATAAIGATWKISDAIHSVKDEIHGLIVKYDDHEERITDLEEHIWDK